MQVRVVQQREEARAVDGHTQLSLIARLRAGDARGNDLAVLVDEVLQQGDVLVVHLLDLLGGEAAELAAAEEAAILVAAVLLGELAAFTFGTSAGRGHAYLSLRRRGLRGGSAFGGLRFGTSRGAGR